MSTNLQKYNTPNSLKRRYNQRRGRWGFYHKVCRPTATVAPAPPPSPPIGGG